VRLHWGSYVCRVLLILLFSLSIDVLSTLVFLRVFPEGLPVRGLALLDLVLVFPLGLSCIIHSSGVLLGLSGFDREILPE